MSSMAENMPKIAEVKSSSCGLEVADFRKNCNCEIAELRLQSNISLKVADLRLRRCFLQDAELRLRTQKKVARAHLCIYIYIYTYATVSNRKWKTEVQAISLNLYTVCSSCKWKFFICPFVDKETNGSFLLANGLPHLC